MASILRKAYRRLRDSSRHDEIVNALYRRLLERGRLTLPKLKAEALVSDLISVTLPVFHPLFAGEDAPLIDLVFLLALARSRSARRILEVGTYRARTTFALHENCPAAFVASYDVQILPSPYRRTLEQAAGVELRHASFSESREVLKKEEPFDLIFVDGAHDIPSVLEDSRLAFEILHPKGIIVWHDYRLNGYRTAELRVPEALEEFRDEMRLFHVQGTTCAIYSPELRSLSVG